MRLFCCFFASIVLCGTLLVAQETLRQSAGRRLHVGCAIAAGDLADPKLSALIAWQFDCITPEYDLMPEHVVDERGQFTFSAGDRLVAFAESHKMPVYGHMLVWHFVTRKWLFADAAGRPLPREEALANLKHYIQTVMRHYGERIAAWDVVNEALSDKEGEYLKDTPALRAIGDDYLEKAFEYAHEAAPHAQLYYNDYNIEQPGKLERALRLIRALQSKHVRLDAVGVQGHWLLDWPPPQMIGRGIDVLAATGVKVMITELDVDVLPRDSSGADMRVAERGADPYRDGLPQPMQQKLAQRYGEIFAVLAARPSVTMITFWGPHDGRSWLNDYPVKGRTNHPLLFDRQLRPKPAFEAGIQSLKAAQAAPLPAHSSSPQAH